MAEEPKQGSSVFEEMSDSIGIEKNYAGLLVGIVVGLITLIIIWFWTSRRRLGRDVLICGSCDSGKTTLLSQLVSSKPVETYTSMKENVHLYTNVQGNVPLTLVDIPGHERIRGPIVEKWAAGARGIIFVIDSNTVTKQVRDVTEFLYSVLTVSSIQSNRPSVLVLCNKQDMGLAKSSQVIKGLLEKEIDKVRVSRNNQLEGQEGGQSGGEGQLGRDGKTFSFSDVGNKVKFVEGNGMDRDNLEQVTQWLSSIA